MHVYRNAIKITTGFGVAFGNYVDAGPLTPGTDYIYEIAAVDPAGNVGTKSPTRNVSTTASSGTNFSANGAIAIAGRSTLLLTFQPFTGAGFYTVEKSTDNATWIIAGRCYHTRAPWQLYVASGLSTGVTYFFRIRAEDEAETFISAYCASFAGTTVTNTPDLPTYPTTLINTKYSLPTGNLWTATNTASNSAAGSGAGNRSGCGLQYAMDNCAAGDVIQVTGGATYNGSFNWPNKGAGSTYTYIVPTTYSSLPAPGTRTSAVDEANMATIQGSVSDFVTASAGAHHLRFVGVRVRPIPGSQFVNGLIALENGTTVLTNLPTNIIFDRCGFIGDPTYGCRRSMNGGGRFIAMIDCHTKDIFQNGPDTQAFWAYNGDGPYLIRNTFLSSSGENVMFGGGQPPSRDAAFIPRDIGVFDNWFWKDPAWLGTGKSLKNLFELKLGIRVFAQYNKYQTSPEEAQAGYSVLLTVRDEAGGAPFFPGAKVGDVMVADNISIDSAAGMQITGADDGDGIVGRTSQRTERVCIYNNYWECRNSAYAGGAGRGWQISGRQYASAIGGPKDLIIRFNTQLLRTTNGSQGTMMLTHDEQNTSSTSQSENFDMSDNVQDAGTGGFATSPGGPTFAAILASDFNPSPAPVSTRNVIIGVTRSGQSSAGFPSGNFFPTDYAAVGFVNYQYTGGNYALSGSSPYKGLAAGGKDPGCDFTRIPT
jgi:hypothetical protein